MGYINIGSVSAYQNKNRHTGISAQEVLLPINQNNKVKKQPIRWKTICKPKSDFFFLQRHYYQGLEVAQWLKSQPDSSEDPRSVPSTLGTINLKIPIQIHK